MLDGHKKKNKEREFMIIRKKTSQKLLKKQAFMYFVALPTDRLTK